MHSVIHLTWPSINYVYNMHNCLAISCVLILVLSLVCKHFYIKKLLKSTENLEVSRKFSFLYFFVGFLTNYLCCHGVKNDLALHIKLKMQRKDKPYKNCCRDPLTLTIPPLPGQPWNINDKKTTVAEKFFSYAAGRAKPVFQVQDGRSVDWMCPGNNILARPIHFRARSRLNLAHTSSVRCTHVLDARTRNRQCYVATSWLWSLSGGKRPAG